MSKIHRKKLVGDYVRLIKK
jgi:hypothetical protein